MIRKVAYEINDVVANEIIDEMDCLSFFAEVTLDEIFAPEWQREKRQPKIKAMSKDYNPFSAGHILISASEDGLRIIDGQHRVDAADLRGCKSILAVVLEGLTPKQEASLWLDCNAHRGAPARYEVFKVLLEKGDPDTLKIHACLQEFDLSISPGNVNGVRAVSAVEQIYYRHGVDNLRDCIRCLLKTFTVEKRKRFSCAILRGTSYLIRHCSNFDERRFSSRLGRFSPSQVQDGAASLRALHSYHEGKAAGLWMATKYNERTKKDLCLDLEVLGGLPSVQDRKPIVGYDEEQRIRKMATSVIKHGKGLSKFERDLCFGLVDDASKPVTLKVVRKVEQIYRERVA